MSYDRKAMAKALCLYAVTDRAWTKTESLSKSGTLSLYQQVEQALRGGVTLVQLREKNMQREAFLREAYDLCKLCHQYGVPLIVNDDVEAALESGADGVHVGQEDMTAVKARALLGKDKILGVSAHSVEEAKLAEAAGADYLGVGAVFGTATKKDAHPIPHQIVRQICQSVSIPVVAIGGVTKENLSQLAGSGVKGVALVSAIFGAKEIEEECKKLLALSKKMVYGEGAFCGIK